MSLCSFVQILFVTLGLGQEEATERLGRGNDDLNYLITHRVGLSPTPQLKLSGFVIPPLIFVDDCMIV